MRVYVASSWRNNYQPGVVHALRADGHEVYDFRRPRDGDNGFHWRQIDREWKTWTPRRYRECLDHPTAQAGFEVDMTNLRWCDAVVAVQPFGISASLELGWAAGAGKITILLLAPGEPELMVKMCDRICIGTDEVIEALREIEDAAVVAQRGRRSRGGRRRD